MPLARGARDAGMEVHVVGPPGPHVSFIEAESFAFHSVPLHRTSINPWRELQTV